jgi:hypothetical protein
MLGNLVKPVVKLVVKPVVKLRIHRQSSWPRELLTYAHVCSRMLMYAGQRSKASSKASSKGSSTDADTPAEQLAEEMRTYAHVC